MLERINQYLAVLDSDELLLLKGHLLIEEQLNRMIELHMSQSTLKSLNLNFYRKVLIAADYSKIEIDTEPYKSVLEINKTRNKLAHNLEHEIKNDLLTIMRDINGGELPKTINRKSTYNNSIRKMLYFLLGNLEGAIQAQSQHLKTKQE